MGWTVVKAKSNTFGIRWLLEFWLRSSFHFEQVTDLVKNLQSLTFIKCKTRLVEIKA